MDGIEVVYCRVKQPLCLAELALFVTFLKQKLQLEPECFYEGYTYVTGRKWPDKVWTLLTQIKALKTDVKGAVVEFFIPLPEAAGLKLEKYKPQQTGTQISFS